MANDEKDLVLVTGGSGFIAVWCIVKCLEAGYRVRTTIRSSKREKDILDMLAEAKVSDAKQVSFVVADLSKDDGWNEAVESCKYVLHVASPFPAAAPKHEDELIIPARDGTLRVLRAAKAANVKRVVVTSSYAAINGAHGERDAANPFSEKDWTDANGPGVEAYAKSKTLAERAAWDFMEKEGGELELAVVNPVTVLGPVLGKDNSTSIEVVLRLMNGSMPGCPRLYFAIVDVRDVADLHMLAMTSPAAQGERFLCDSPPAMSVKEISLCLKERMGNAARKCPTMSLPDILLKAIALFDKSVALVVPWLGKIEYNSIDKAKDVLGWKPRSSQDALVATAESVIKLGMIKAK